MDKTLKKILDVKSQKGINDRNFARALGLHDGIVSDWKSGRSSSYLKYLSEIAEILEIEPSSLFDIQNQQFVKDHTATVHFDAEKIAEAILKSRKIRAEHADDTNSLLYEMTYNLDECSLLKHFRMLNIEGQSKLADYLLDLLDTGKYSKNNS